MSTANPRGTYLLIANAVRNSLEQGHLEDGTLPSEATLSQTHGVSRNTVRRALKKLESEGLISSIPGAGWKASAGPARPLTDRLIELISVDSLKVGDTYPSESKLCERFGVSRTAVRGALAQMEGKGLLATTPGKGRTVLALPASVAQPYS